MRRGQAFEVFRLLIAAVIAGAILMVLLNVLGGLTITTQDPDDFVRQAVKSMAAEGGANGLCVRRHVRGGWLGLFGQDLYLQWCQSPRLHPGGL